MQKKSVEVTADHKIMLDIFIGHLNLGVVWHLVQIKVEKSGIDWFWAAMLSWKNTDSSIQLDGHNRLC